MNCFYRGIKIIFISNLDITCPITYNSLTYNITLVLIEYKINGNSHFPYHHTQHPRRCYKSCHHRQMNVEINNVELLLSRTSLPDTGNRGPSNHLNYSLENLSFNMHPKFSTSC